LLASDALFLAVNSSFDDIPMLVVAAIYVAVLTGLLLNFLGQMEEKDRENKRAERKSEAGFHATV